MTAEKEIINYWYNKKGFFTINNIKTSNNKDAGILALKFDRDKIDDKIDEILHIGVSCSITNNTSLRGLSNDSEKIAETINLGKSIGKIVDEKFSDKKVLDAIKEYIRQFMIEKQRVSNVIVLGAVTKSRKNEIISEFNKKEVEVIEFENILYDVLENLDTQYYKNDTIRTLQLTKFLLLNEPTKLAKLLINDTFSSASRKEFLSSILDKDQIIKEFKKTNVERLGAILKNSGLNPTELAKMLEHNILNKKTRKAFLNSLMEQEKARKIVNGQKRVKKVNMPLGRFF